ncbi:dehydrogenase/reductase SDR family member 11-like [Gordionus sp. m RMFG-2023]|uniref:dehydrogenase/reductase SDR family member 11-like n=1 Tax=Gordionus sp. m RMFG-2023 TaxID=3053472 RepID=UPI0031FBCFEF
MEKWQNKVVLVTGAAQGLGKCIAQSLASNGMIVVACDIRADKLEDLVKNYKGKPGEAGSIEAVKCDISKVEDILRLFCHIEQKFKTLHACVNNAAVGREESEKSEIYESWKYILEVNVLGVAICSKEAVNLMTKLGVVDGLIVNISSVMGKQVSLSTLDEEFGFYNHMYVATKHAVTALTQCLRLEIQRRTYASAKNIYEKYSNLSPEDVCDALLFVFKCDNNVQIDDMMITPVRHPGKL